MLSKSNKKNRSYPETEPDGKNFTQSSAITKKKILFLFRCMIMFPLDLFTLVVIKIIVASYKVRFVDQS